MNTNPPCQDIVYDFASIGCVVFAESAGRVLPAVGFRAMKILRALPEIFRGVAGLSHLYVCVVKLVAMTGFSIVVPFVY